MFKKTLAALVVFGAFGAFAASASAADVQLYGRIDTGLVYSHVDQDNGFDADDTFQMKSGYTTGSRWGVKGTEDLGNGLTVGFVLENGFSGDTGELGDSDRLFNRESQVFVRGGFGELSFGRVGQLTSGNGTYGLAGNLSPFGTTWGDYSANASNVMVGFGRMDNTVTYKSPAFAGFNVYAQYSFDTDSLEDNEQGTGEAHGTEGKASVDRYYAIAATYANGPAKAVLIVDSTNYSSKFYAGENRDFDDSLSVTFGGSWDFGVVKPYFGAQYFDNADLSTVGVFGGFDADINRGDLHSEGYGLTIGADIPLFGGTAKVGASYIDGDYESYATRADTANFETGDYSAWAVSVGYEYYLSKRTNVYTGLSYMSLDESEDHSNDSDWEPSAVEFAVGLVHKF